MIAVRIERRVRQTTATERRRDERGPSGADIGAPMLPPVRHSHGLKRTSGAIRRVNSPVAIMKPSTTRIEPDTAAIAA